MTIPTYINNKTSGVYKITNIINNKCYIGSSAAKTGMRQRLRNHIISLTKNKHHSIHLQNSWNKYGENNFICDLLESCKPEECISKEQYYIDTLNPEYNICRVAGSSLGKKLTPEHIEKIKNRSYDWMRGENNWNKSPEKREFYRQRIKSINLHSYQTQETFDKISKFHKGKPKSEIQKQRMSAAAIGKPKSKEQVDKMRIFMKEWAKDHICGDKNYFHIHKDLFLGEKNPRFSGYFKFKNKITNEEFSGSKMEFSKKFSLHYSKICAICNGKRKSTKKWICLGKDKNYETLSK